MFFRKAEEDSVSKDLVSFLNQVDTLYMQAYTTKSTRVLKSYISRDCAVKLSSSIFTYNTRHFGTDKFRTTVWSIVKQEGAILLVRKDVTFDKVKIGKNVKMSVADNYSEHWVVDYRNIANPVVLDISSIREDV